MMCYWSCLTHIEKRWVYINKDRSKVLDWSKTLVLCCDFLRFQPCRDDISLLISVPLIWVLMKTWAWIQPAAVKTALSRSSPTSMSVTAHYGVRTDLFMYGSFVTLLWFMFSDGLLKKTKVKSKKKPRRRLDSSGGYNLSDIIHSSPTDIIPSPPSLGEPAYSKVWCIYIISNDHAGFHYFI